MNDVQGPRFHSRINFALHSGLSVGCVTTRGNTRTDGQLGAARAHYHHSYQPHTANNITSSLASITISRILKLQEIWNLLLSKMPCRGWYNPLHCTLVPCFYNCACEARERRGRFSHCFKKISTERRKDLSESAKRFTAMLYV